MVDMKSIFIRKYWSVPNKFNCLINIDTENYCYLGYIEKYMDLTTSYFSTKIPDSKVHRTNMGPTWVLSAPDGPYVGPMNLAIWDNFVTLHLYTNTKRHIQIITIALPF